MKNFVSYYYVIKEKSTREVRKFIGDVVVDYPIKSEGDIKYTKKLIEEGVRAACGSYFEFVSASIITWRPLDE